MSAFSRQTLVRRAGDPEGTAAPCCLSEPRRSSREPPDGPAWNSGGLCGLTPCGRGPVPAGAGQAGLTPHTTVRGRYGAYQAVEGVAPRSVPVTYVVVWLVLDSWRWADVPIGIWAGTTMPVIATELDIRFRRPPHGILGP